MSGAQAAEPPADPAVKRGAWRLLGAPLVRLTPHNFNPVRRAILRLFGARIGARAKVRRTARIDRPWNLALGALSAIGDDAVIVARWPVTIGERCVISQHTLMVTEVRDPVAAGHPSRGAPIRIEDDCWVAADALVMPGSIIRRGTVAGARSLVEGELPEWVIAVGEPARPRGPRRLRGDVERTGT